MINEQIVAMIQAGDDVAGNMARLWEKSRAFIARMARRFRGYEEFEDLQQQGYIALCDAVDGYRAEEGVPFINYAALWIRRGMARYVEEGSCLIRLPSDRSAAVRQYRKLCRMYEAALGRGPTEWEAARSLEISREQARALEKDGSLRQVGSLDRPVQEDEEETVLGDLVSDGTDPQGKALDQIQPEQLNRLLWPMVEALDPEQAAVIRMRYREEKSFCEIGEGLGIPEKRARQEERKGLHKLGTPHRRAVLAPYLYDYVDAQARKGCGVGQFRRTWTSSTERVALELAKR